MSEDLQYPTRSYPYRARLDRAGPDPSRDLDVSFGESVETPDVPGLKARLVGVDPYAGRDISPGELERLDDPLARLLLKRGTFPRTLQQLLDALNAFNGDPGGVPHQNVFFISEWGQIPLNSTTARYPRQIRYILTRGRNEIGAADILVSTAPPSDDAGIFLQVAAWDRTNEVFHFYERGLRTSTWFWAGSSWDALAPPTRGKGPFDSHVNGAPVMKERKEPWLHWHSISQDIPRQNFPPGHPINRASEDAFVNQCQSAHLLQTQIVEPAVRRWTDARLRRVLGSSGIADPGALMRQVLTDQRQYRVGASTQPVGRARYRDPADPSCRCRDAAQIPSGRAPYNRACAPSSVRAGDLNPSNFAAGYTAGLPTSRRCLLCLGGA